MIKKTKKIISLLMIFVFIIPLTVKSLDGFFHHHHHSEHNSKFEYQFHDHHEKCPILSYELSLSSLNDTTVEIAKTYYCDGFIINYTSSYYSNNSKYSFLLRAPPYFLNKI